MRPAGAKPLRVLGLRHVVSPPVSERVARALVPARDRSAPSRAALACAASNAASFSALLPTALMRLPFRFPSLTDIIPLPTDVLGYPKLLLGTGLVLFVAYEALKF